MVINWIFHNTCKNDTFPYYIKIKNILFFVFIKWKTIREFCCFVHYYHLYYEFLLLAILARQTKVK